MSEFAGLLIGFLLTLFIFSYVIGDNRLYRLAVHVLLGVTAAYAAVVVTQQIFLPIFRQLSDEPGTADNLLWLIPLGLALMLAMKFVRPVAWLGNGAVAALIGIGMAVGLTGAIAGTLLPQIIAPVGDSVIITVTAAAMTICVLLYFQFTGYPGQRGEWVAAPWRQAVSTVGRGVLMVTLGAVFAGLLSTSLVLLVARVSYYLDGFLAMFGA